MKKKGLLLLAVLAVLCFAQPARAVTEKCQAWLGNWTFNYGDNESKPIHGAQPVLFISVCDKGEACMPYSFMNCIAYATRLLDHQPISIVDIAYDATNVYYLEVAEPGMADPRIPIPNATRTNDFFVATTANIFNLFSGVAERGCIDADLDGYGDNCTAGPDCDDNNSAVNPGAAEVCNGIDDNCDNQTDVGCVVGTLTGTVNDALSSNPIGGATVRAGAVTQVTGAGGQYTFTYMTVGAYDMTVAAPGYDNGTATGVIVTENATTIQDFVLSAGLLGVDPTSLTANLPAGASTTLTVTLNNTGTRDVWFQILKQLRWLRMSPATGTVAAGDNQTVVVSFNATGLAAGTYTGNLEIKNDTPYGTLTVPVTLNVESAPASACIDRDGDGYGDNCTAGPDCKDDDAFYNEICPEDCEVKIIPGALGWFLGDKEKTRLLLVIGERGRFFDDNTAVRWDTEGIKVIRKRVFFRRFMLMTISIDGAVLDKDEYRALIGECPGKLTLVK